MPDEAPRPFDRVNFLNITLVIILSALLVMIGQFSVRQSNLERRVTSTEMKLDRLEGWTMSNSQLSVGRHTELMKLLTSLNANTNYIVEYYRRAQAEAEK